MKNKFNYGDAVDTGQCGAMRQLPSSEQEKEKTFENFRKRLREYLKSEQVDQAKKI